VHCRNTTRRCERRSNLERNTTEEEIGGQKAPPRLDSSSRGFEHVCSESSMVLSGASEPAHASEPASLPTRRSPATGRGRLPDGGPQSAEDGVVGATEPPRAPQPCDRPEPIAGLRPVECRGCCRRSQQASPSAATMQQAGTGCRTAARRVQGMVMSEPASPREQQPCNRQEQAAGRRPVECKRWCSQSQQASQRTAALQPAGAGCRTTARRVQRMVSSKSGGGLQGADDGVVEASPPRAPTQRLMRSSRSPSSMQQ
jgi:hypothetical protein